MTIEKNNAEGYYDPTAYEALSRIEREARLRPFRPLVYICSPYAGDIADNTRKAREYSAFAVGKGVIPLAPHLLFPQFMDDGDPEARDLALCMATTLLGKCRELWVFGDTVSRGMALEIEKARRRRIPIRRYTALCQEVPTDE